MVRDDGRRETIEPRVMEVLVALASADGIVGRGELVDRCWGGRTVSEDAINRIISRVRRLSEGIGAGVFGLETITKVGYRLIRSESEAAKTSPAISLPALQTPDPPIPPAISTSPRVGRRAAVGGLGALALAGVGGVALWRTGSAQADTSIAVMPFTDLSGDPRQTYFAGGVAEEVRDALGRLPKLKVIARSSSEAVGGADLVAAARELGVGHILTGSVRRSPSMIRVSAQLIDGRDGTEMWSQSYDRAPGDTLSIQSSIAQSIASSLSLTLSLTLSLRDKAAIVDSGTANYLAHDLYLQANATFLVAGEEETKIRQTLASADAALKLDPDYAAAHVLRAQALERLGGFYGDAQANFAAAAEAAKRAIALAPTNSAGYSELASVRAYQLRLADALALYHRAAAIGEDATYLRYASVFYACLGRAREADALIEKLFAVDPISGLSYKNQAWACWLNGEFDQAITASHQLAKLAPGEFYSFYFAASAMIAAGRYREGITEVSAMPADNILRPVLETIAWHKLGDRARVARSLERLHELAGDGASIQRAWIHAQFGEIDAAFDRLDRALERRSWVLIEVPANPFLAPLRADPRFPVFLKRLGLP